MRKYQGFTLIEALIVIAIIGIVVTIIFPATTGQISQHDISYGTMGTVETRCISGFKFTVGRNGSTQQIMDENGHGIPCQ